MRIRAKFFNFVVFIFILLIGVFFHLTASSSQEATPSADQVRNFNNDMAKASVYWKYNKLGDAYSRNGEYFSAIEEYTRAIKMIEDSPDEYTRTDVSKERRERVNRELKVSSQIYSRYGLIEALEKVGRYEEALQNVEWLMKNQVMKGKEELLKQRLERMKQNIQKQMQTSRESSATAGATR